MAPEPIAIVGTACRFSGSASTPSKLWELLCDPRDIASKPPANRFNIDSFYHPNASNPTTTSTTESYFLSEDVMEFDASFFNIAKKEALSLDPQQRMLLEVVYESLEAAGLRLEALRGSATGMFCGVMNSDWEGIMALGRTVPQYASIGMARNNLANRVSYFFDWNGPSMSIDTACSSSMVALHEAVTALRLGECTASAVAGVNLILSPNFYVTASNLQMLSPNGRGRMWDAQADGYARGDGVGCVILKRLSDAVADGDRIECVIRATGVNQDGRSMGLTMPSSSAQLNLIRSTYALAGLDPGNHPEDRCQYFEAHGTGTQVSYETFILV
ncbi:putative PKS/NRPS-like protein biosynthetic cluster [Arthroderma sp. PD_2]|nr:putative PKS/NRPS-like protein biosynthetic cluster [Arthroderma sp. PD_2]